MNQLRKIRDNLTVYDAGLPRFPRNFTRDGIISALLFEDAAMMRDQLRFCALHQGKTTDPHTGEEPGKMFHEFPGYPLRGLNTQFNGCDTTGLWLYGLAHYINWTGDRGLADELNTAVTQALVYVQTHLRSDHLFEEAPSYCGAERFALKVTYWKDSVLHGRPDGETAWPAVFTLAHVQTMAGVRAMGEILADEDLKNTADKMLAALQLLWDEELGCYLSALDSLGSMRLVTSDPLHMLAYLRPGDISGRQVEQIVAASRPLETPLGYVVMPPAAADTLQYDYHGKTVWPFEQAMIHLGAATFEQPHVTAVCQRVIPHIQTAAPETLSTDPNLNSPSCDPQLWTLAARAYFARQ